jgi:hypothetical protein
MSADRLVWEETIMLEDDEFDVGPSLAGAS